MISYKSYTDTNGYPSNLKTSYKFYKGKREIKITQKCDLQQSKSESYLKFFIDHCIIFFTELLNIKAKIITFVTEFVYRHYDSVTDKLFDSSSREQFS